MASNLLSHMKQRDSSESLGPAGNITEHVADDGLPSCTAGISLTRRAWSAVAAVPTNFITNIVPPKNINNLKTNKKVQRKEKFHSECILSKIEVGRRLKKYFRTK